MGCVVRGVGCGVLGWGGVGWGGVGWGGVGEWVGYSCYFGVALYCSFKDAATSVVFSGAHDRVAFCLSGVSRLDIA